MDPGPYMVAGTCYLLVHHPLNQLGSFLGFLCFLMFSHRRRILVHVSWGNYSVAYVPKVRNTAWITVIVSLGIVSLRK